MVKSNRFVIFTMVGKGGVGKSTTSVWLHQYLSSKGYNVEGYDTDPVNATYHSFDSLDTTHINIYNKNSEIDKSLFDKLVESHLLEMPESTAAIIDSGATSFNAMLTYMDENNIVDLLAEFGIETYISIPVVGGSEHNETLKGLVALHEKFACKKIVWLNRFFGAMPEGEESPYKTIPLLLGDTLLGIVDIPDLNADTFGRAIKEMQRKRYGFVEFFADERIGLMMRTRIKRFGEMLYSEMDKVLPFKGMKAIKGRRNKIAAA